MVSYASHFCLKAIEGCIARETNGDFGVDNSCQDRHLSARFGITLLTATAKQQALEAQA